ncbi:MAG: hypothetical protein OHK0015_33520 [Chloroflexi bacterium OHK40]
MSVPHGPPPARPPPGAGHTAGLLLMRSDADAQLATVIESLGFQVIGLAGEGIHSARWQQVSLVITDTLAARTYAHELRELRLRTGLGPPPIVLLLSPGARFPKWARAGFDEILHLPLAPAELTARIEALARHHFHTLSERRAAEEAARHHTALLRGVLRSLSQHLVAIDSHGTIIAVNESWEQFGREHGANPDAIGVGANYLAECRRAAMAGNVWAQQALTGVEQVLAGTLPAFHLEYPCTSVNGHHWYTMAVTAMSNGAPGAVILYTEISEQKEIEQALATKARQQEVIARLGQRALGERNPTVFPQLVVEEVARTLAVDLCAFKQLLPGGDALLLRAGVGWAPGAVGSTLVESGRNSLSGYTLLSDGPVKVEHLARDERFSPSTLLIAHGVVSSLSVAVRGATEPLGVLNVHTTRHHRFTDDDSLFLQAAANLIAAALDWARADGAVRFQAHLLDVVGQAVIATSQEGRVTYWNRAAERLLGWSSGEAIGRLLEELAPTESTPLDPNTIVQQPRLGAAGPVELQLRRRDGAHLPVLVNDSPITNNHGERMGSVRVASDLTDRKALEAQLIHAQRLESVGQLAGGVAHDFNNMLTVISGYASFAAGSLAPDHPVQHDLREIERAATQASNLTRQLLTFARKQSMAPELLDLNTLVMDVHRMLRRLIGEHIELVIRPLARQSIVRADASQIEQVLVNLVINARDAMPRGGRITIETITRADEAEAPASVVLTVHDTGHGMPPEVQARAFEPFFTTKAPGKGTGLGLATSYGIIVQHGGQIALSSEPGRGTSVTISLPIVSDQQLAPMPVAHATADPTGWETVLVAEDDAAIRALVVRTLGTLGYTVLAASDGMQALALARSFHGPIHLLLSDIVMPQLSGDLLASQLLAQRPETAVLLMSGYTDQATASDLPPSVLSQPLQKPFTPSMLTRHVRMVLDAHSRRAE